MGSFRIQVVVDGIELMRAADEARRVREGRPASPWSWASLQLGRRGRVSKGDLQRNARADGRRSRSQGSPRRPEFQEGCGSGLANPSREESLENCSFPPNVTPPAMVSSGLL